MMRQITCDSHRSTLKKNNKMRWSYWNKTKYAWLKIMSPKGIPVEDRRVVSGMVCEKLRCPIVETLLIWSKLLIAILVQVWIRLTIIFLELPFSWTSSRNTKILVKIWLQIRHPYWVRLSNTWKINKWLTDWVRQVSAHKPITTMSTRWRTFDCAISFSKRKRWMIYNRWANR